MRDMLWAEWYSVLQNKRVTWSKFGDIHNHLCLFLMYMYMYVGYGHKQIGLGLGSRCFWVSWVSKPFLVRAKVWCISSRCKFVICVDNLHLHHKIGHVYRVIRSVAAIFGGRNSTCNIHVHHLPCFRSKSSRFTKHVQPQSHLTTN